MLILLWWTNFLSITFPGFHRFNFLLLFYSCETEIASPDYLRSPESKAKYGLLNAQGKPTFSLRRALAGVEVSKRMLSLISQELGLNTSQCEAYMAALTQELSIIQGNMNVD